MKIIINNLKMNLSLTETIEYENKLSKVKTDNQIIVCPSFPYLGYFRSNNYILGSQDVSKKRTGDYTGEVSACQLYSMDVKYTIVGHPERKQCFKETPANISSKILNLFDYDITPILCVGETEEEKDNYENIVLEELKEFLEPIDNIKELIVAYEPIWAIGNDDIPSSEAINKVVAIIKNYIKDKYNKDIKVVYGGGVNIKNMSILNNTNVDGYMLGRVALNVLEYEKLLEVMK